MLQLWVPRYSPIATVGWRLATQTSCIITRKTIETSPSDEGRNAGRDTSPYKGAASNLPILICTTQFHPLSNRGKARCETAPPTDFRNVHTRPTSRQMSTLAWTLWQSRPSLSQGIQDVAILIESQIRGQVRPSLEPQRPIIPRHVPVHATTPAHDMQARALPWTLT